jgi:hypothetical protein
MVVWATYVALGPELDPESISERTTLTPTRVSHVGERLGPPPSRLTKKASTWTFRVGEPDWTDVVDVNEALTTLFDRLAPGWDLLVELGRVLARDERSGAVVEVGVNIVCESQTGWNIPPATLEKIAALGASLDIVVDDYRPWPGDE